MKKILKWGLAILGLTLLVFLNYWVLYNLLTCLRAFIVIGSHSEAAAATGALFFAALLSWLDVRVYKIFF